MAALTLVVGDEELLVSRAVTRALGAASVAASALLDAGADEVISVSHDIDAGQASVEDLAEILGPSLFAEDRAVVVRNLQDADKAFVAVLVEFVEAPQPGMSVVAVHAGGVKGKAIVETLRQAGAQAIMVAPVKSMRDREQFVVDEVRAAGASLDHDAAAELVAAIGTDLRELSTSAAQLAADVGGLISVEEVATYYRGRAESTGFAVADRAVDGDAAAALETLRWAFATGLDPVLVSSSLAANLRLIAQVGAAGPGSPDALAAKLRMPAWKIRRAQGWLRRWRPDAVGTAIRAVAVADADLKGAADDAAYAVERAVLTVAAAASHVDGR